MRHAWEGSRQLLFIATFSVAILLFGIAGAYNSPPVAGNPVTMGHSVDELDWGQRIPSIYSGSIGIGTATPVRELHIDAAGGSGSTAGIFIQDPTTNTDYGADLYFDDSSSTFRIATRSLGAEVPGIFVARDSGNVGIGSSPTGNRLTVAGNMAAAGSITATGDISTSGSISAASGITVDSGSDICISGGNCLSSVSTSGGNTLDAAYDQGGAGMGRTITADSGAVVISGPNGLSVNGPLTVGSSSPSGSLKMDIEGMVGATAYCDEDGNNCKTLSALSNPLPTTCDDGDGLKWDSGSGSWICDSGTCTPDCSCAAITCIGSTCSDGCGGTCSGTKNCCVPDCSCAAITCIGSTCSDGCGGTCSGTETCQDCGRQIIGTSPIGTPCSTNSNCITNNCARNVYGKYVCTCDTEDCHCSTDASCQSCNCNQNVYGTYVCTCNTEGCPCDADHSCLTNNCERNVYGNYVCTCNTIGCDCSSDDNCQTNNCAMNVYGNYVCTCNTSGCPCSDDGDCVSNNCHQNVYGKYVCM